jgi:hypothetical protein
MLQRPNWVCCHGVDFVFLNMGVADVLHLVLFLCVCVYVCMCMYLSFCFGVLKFMCILFMRVCVYVCICLCVHMHVRVWGWADDLLRE